MRLSRACPRPTDMRSATKTGFHNQAMKRSDDPQVGPAQEVVAPDDGRDSQLATERWRKARRAEYRQPEIQVLVVLAQDDLVFAPAVDPEDADAVGIGFAGESRKVSGGIQTKARNDRIPDVGEPSDPGWLLRNKESLQDIRIAGGAQGKLNRKCVREIRRFIKIGDGRLRGKSDRLDQREWA
jgi:hypothetical protein